MFPRIPTNQLLFNEDGLLPWVLDQDDPRLDFFRRSSPYLISIGEFVENFAFNVERRNIIRNFISLRRDLRTIGYKDGFQWVGGSFVEDVEKKRGRPPADIDVLSFLDWPARIHNSKEYVDFNSSEKIHRNEYAKARYQCDHHFVDLKQNISLYPAYFYIKNITEWFTLYSNDTTTGKKKGFLSIPFYSEDNDDGILLELISNRDDRQP